MAKAEDKIGIEDYRCSCGMRATYMYDCGCLCCGSDPCEFNCGGSVEPIEEQLEKGIKPRGGR
jgi:hypothetical protein